MALVNENYLKLQGSYLLRKLLTVYRNSRRKIRLPKLSVSVSAM